MSNVKNQKKNKKKTEKKKKGCGQNGSKEEVGNFSMKDKDLVSQESKAFVEIKARVCAGEEQEVK